MDAVIHEWMELHRDGVSQDGADMQKNSYYSRWTYQPRSTYQTLEATDASAQVERSLRKDVGH